MFGMGATSRVVVQREALDVPRAEEKKGIVKYQAR